MVTNMLHLAVIIVLKGSLITVLEVEPNTFALSYIPTPFLFLF